MSTQTLGIVSNNTLYYKEQLAGKTATFYAKNKKRHKAVTVAKLDTKGGVIFNSAIFKAQDIEERLHYLPSAKVQTALTRYKNIDKLLQETAKVLGREIYLESNKGL